MKPENNKIKDGIESILAEAKEYEWNLEKCFFVVDPSIEEEVKLYAGDIPVVSSAVLSKGIATLRNNDNGRELSFIFL